MPDSRYYPYLSVSRLVAVSATSLLLLQSTVSFADDTEDRKNYRGQNRLYFMTTGLNFIPRTVSVDLSTAEFPRIRYSPTSSFELDVAWFPPVSFQSGKPIDPAFEVGGSWSVPGTAGFYRGTTISLHGGYFGALYEWCSEYCVQYLVSEVDEILEIPVTRSTPLLLRPNISISLAIHFFEAHVAASQIYYWGNPDFSPEAEGLRFASLLQFGAALHILSKPTPVVSLQVETLLRFPEERYGRRDAHFVYIMTGPRIHARRFVRDLAVSIDPDQPDEYHPLDTQSVFGRISFQL